MPELPEVETVMRGLTPVMAGARFERVLQRRPDLRFPLPERFAARLQGRRIEGLSRRAKYVLVALEGDEVLVMHLGMSGRFIVEDSQLGRFTHNQQPASVHDHIVFEMSNGGRVTFNDARRFGYMDLIGTAAMPDHPWFIGLGPEPLSDDFDAAALAAKAHGRAVDLKALLLDQKVVAGLGNIYVSEALHDARLSPLRKAATLARKNGAPLARTETLVANIKDVLNRAILAGGSTLRDYQQTDGSLGYFQNAHKVYDRADEACLRSGCRGTVRRIVQSGRATFYCPHCQA